MGTCGNGYLIFTQINIHQMRLAIPQAHGVEISESVGVAHGTRGRFTLAVNFETGIPLTRDIPWWASDFYWKRVIVPSISSMIIDTKIGEREVLKKSPGPARILQECNDA